MSLPALSGAVSFPGYRVTESIQNGNREFAVYRAKRDKDDALILIKLPNSQHVRPLTGRYLENELYLLGGLPNLKHVIRPLALDRLGDRSFLILANVNGKPLEQSLGRPLDLGRFLEIAVQISAALEEIHGRGITHKSVRPQNIYFDPETKEIKITDFTIATLLPQEYPMAQNLDFREEALPYLSPEQTGRMNRYVDYRTDLYSLGVTLYQMLTGQWPFQVKNHADPLEWVYCHIAKTPAAPIELDPAIPKTVSEIIMRLLAKLAEDRYQTARGLKHDLEWCLKLHTERRMIAPFELLKKDIPDRFQVPQKIYGRETELRVLLHSFDRIVNHGAPEMALVSGYSGVGKSSLVHELNKPVAQARGFFITGKFDQQKRDIPYSTIIQASKELIQQVLTKGEEKLELWRQQLKADLGPNARLIVDVIPELELIIGKQKRFATLPAAETKDLFNFVFQRFIGAFANKEHPLAIFLDDLQWADAASLKLIEYLLTHPETRFLFLVGAYRDNEVSSSHPLTFTLDQISKSGAIVRKITLGPLSLKDLDELLADTLRCKPTQAESLSRLVHEKTDGNPFFVIQFLRELCHENLLTFDAKLGEWRWDIDKIQAKNFTENMADLMVGKLKRLKPQTQSALKLAACIGNRFEVQTLATLNGSSEEQVRAALWEAIHDSLLLNVGDAYKFLHDRVQQAAYLLIPKDELPRLHLEIARTLLNATPEHEMRDKIYDIINQFNPGIDLLTSPTEKHRVAVLYLTAGRRAKSENAYRSAFNYFDTGARLLGEQAWQAQYQLSFDLHLERGECAWLLGNFSESERLLTETLGRAEKKIHKESVYRALIHLHTAQANMAKAIDIGVDCLAMFGISLSPRPSFEEVRHEYDQVRRYLDNRSAETLLEPSPTTSDPVTSEMHAAVRTLTAIFAPCVYTDLNLFCLAICKSVHLSLRHGAVDASLMGYVTFAAILGNIFGKYDEGYRIGLIAYQHAKKFDILAYRSKVGFVFGFLTNCWTHGFESCIEYLRDGFDSGVTGGDLTFACWSGMALVHIAFIKGAPLKEVYAHSERFLEFAQNNKFTEIAAAIFPIQRIIRALEGSTLHLSTLSGDDFDESRYEAYLNEKRSPVANAYYYAWISQLLFIAGKPEKILALRKKFEPVLWAIAIRPEIADHHYYEALALAQLCATAPPEKQQEHIAGLHAHQRRLKEWALNSPENFF